MGASQATPIQRAQFWYGSDGQRYLREDSGSGVSGTRRTQYLGSVEIITEAGVTTTRRYVAGVAVQEIKTTTSTKYLFHDHLGSVVRVSNAAGGALEGMDFGPFGERRGYADPRGLPTFSSATNRGFTGHEMLDGLDIVHMNGRIYDSRIARFLQVDPFVQEPNNPQNFNRYSYLWNNPLNGTDPSGYLGIKERQWLGVAITIAAIVTQQYYLVNYGVALGSASFVAYYAAVGAISGGVSTQSTQGALWGAFSGAAMAAMGGVTSGWNDWSAGLAMGTTAGTISVMQGGKFGHAFASAGLGRLSQGLVPSGRSVANTLKAAMVGGSVSAISGGKFANGAVTSMLATTMSAGFQSAIKPSADQITHGRLAMGVYDPTFEGADGYNKAGDTFIDKDTGLQAALFLNDSTGHRIMAFAGTNGLSDWPHNFRQAFGLESAQYTQAMGWAQTVYDSYGGNVHFVGHSLGGGLAVASAIVTGGSATVFNAAGVHPNTVGGLVPAQGSTTHFRSSLDVLQPINALTPARVHGTQVMLRPAGEHGMGGICRAIGC